MWKQTVMEKYWNVENKAKKKMKSTIMEKKGSRQ